MGLAVETRSDGLVIRGGQPRLRQQFERESQALTDGNPVVLVTVDDERGDIDVAQLVPARARRAHGEELPGRSRGIEAAIERSFGVGHGTSVGTRQHGSANYVESMPVHERIHGVRGRR